MNINKFTQNSMQAVQNCEKIAYDYGNQELAQEKSWHMNMETSRSTSRICCTAC